MLRGMWDLPRPGLEPVSPALAGRFSTAAPPEAPIRQLLRAVIVGTREWGWQEGWGVRERRAQTGSLRLREE